jgi:tRNA(fMet)-specific endonuclease VapC
MPYILDADWIIHVISGNTAAAAVIERLSPQKISVSWVTVGEIYEIAYNGPNPEAQLDIYRRFLMQFEIIGLGELIIEHFAEIRSFLRRQGRMISDFDIILAATALHHDLTVLTFNRRHFERIPDLRIYRFN